MIPGSWQYVESPVGRLVLLARKGKLCSLRWDSAGEDADGVSSVSSLPEIQRCSPVIEWAAQELQAYFAGELAAFTVPLDLDGLSSFTRTVLQELQAVAIGETITYGELAARAGNPKASRAVGRVMAINPLPIIIPCHRVTAAGGRMGGYSGGNGLPTKLKLLQLEAHAAMIASSSEQRKTY